MLLLVVVVVVAAVLAAIPWSHQLGLSSRYCL
jgi:hypothetical protein